MVPDGANKKGEDLYRINVSEIAMVKIPSIHTIEQASNDILDRLPSE